MTRINATRDPVSFRPMEQQAAGEEKSGPATTLADVLYAGNPDRVVDEQEWAALIRSLCASDARALHALYEWSHRIVFTLALQITHDRSTADDVTVDVLHDAWRQASRYDPAKETVVGWIMNRTRARSIDRRGIERRSKRRKPGQDNTLVELQPSASVWRRLESRIWADTGAPALLSLESRPEPRWKEVAGGIYCKLLATDNERNRVSMLVRLAPGTDYPPHRHAGVEELHLLHGELMIDDRKVCPGDYNRAEPGSRDSRVWSETGCSCVLITSTRDELG